MKKSTILLLLILILWLSTANSETVTTDNLLSNSTFGTGTTYDTTGWTISSGTSGHGNTTIGEEMILVDLLLQQEILI